MITASISPRQQAINETYRYIDMANEKWGLNIPHVPIDFKLRGTTAGKAWSRPGQAVKIQYQPVILAENVDHFIKQTVPHEVAHLVVACLYPFGRTRPHGYEWQNVMRFFGVRPDRCHNYDVTNVRQARQKLNRVFQYKCNCQVYNLTIIRHKRIMAGSKYSCKKCGGVLLPV